MEQRITRTLEELAKCPVTPGCYEKCRECQFKDHIPSGYCKSALFEYYMNCPNRYTTDSINTSSEQKIINIFNLLGIPSHLRGYKYLEEAVILAIKNPNAMDFVCRDVYPALAEAFNSTPSRIERGIRHAIESGWIRGDPEVQYRIFGNSVNPDKGKPTNSEFIATIADRLRAENNGTNA